MSSISTTKSRPSTVSRSSTAVGSGGSDRPPRAAAPQPKRIKKPNKASTDQLRAKEEEYM